MSIKIDNLIVKCNNQVCLKMDHLHIPETSRVLVLGPNGAGKSTFFKALINYNCAITGNLNYHNLILNKLDLPTLTSLIAYLPQNLEQVLHYAVVDLFKFALHDQEVLKNLISEFNLAPLLNKKLEHLSAGQQKLIYLCSVLSQTSKIIVLDEPWNCLDFNIRQTIKKILFDYVKNTQKILILSSHDNILDLQEYTHILAIESGAISFFKTTEDLQTQEIANLFKLSVQAISHKRYILE